LPNSNVKKPKILLHSCCAPCLTHPLEELQKDFEVVLFFYNPNIHPREEYEMRLTEAKRYCLGKCEILEEKYDPEVWFEKIKGFENEPERGARCRICYEMRLAKTAEFAAKSGFQFFATTLSISPHKNADWLNEIGQKLSSKYKIKFLESNWKKCDGFKKSLELSKSANLKRQNYCGCVFSRQAVDKKPVE
jgi:predicted adenine nucleotide alpha hydrolase (AANH) superfamily ATPase